MRILLSGTSGQVGGALAVLLTEFGEVVAASRVMLDLADVASIPEKLDAIAPQVIVNPAAYTAVDRAEDEPELAFRINGEAPGAMARWAAAHKVPVVHFSTDYVFSGSGERPWREDDATGPLSIYGTSKLQGEQAVRAAGGPHLIVRSSWVYHRTGTNFLRTIARLAAERDELRIVADQIGAPTSATLIGATLTELVRKFGGDFSALTAASGGTVHLAASGEASWHDFASAIIAGLKARGRPVRAACIVPITTSEYPAKATRPLNSRLDLSRLTSLLGHPMPPWRTALETELDHIAHERA
ncbi:MAG: dTDP-4-dehydrorhamnose reductase [Xanthobacteraceae bacterium]|nr:dTDP-4-dehydrorhamnose reductase [Xanthobacteraceae bacterium]